MKFSHLFIWGPNPFTNKLFSSHVESFAGLTPCCISSAKEIDFSTYSNKSLIFCDCDKIDPLSYCHGLYKPGNDLERTPCIFLVNVSPEYELVDEIKIFPIYGIFYRTDPFELIGKGIEKVLEGEHWLSRNLLVQSLQSTRNSFKIDSNKMLTLLTTREQEIVKLIAVGQDNQSIADHLYISPNTVKTHISNIYKKIDVSNRVQAILWASENIGCLIPHPHLLDNEHVN